MVRKGETTSVWVTEQKHCYCAIQAGLLTPLTFARHRLSPLMCLEISNNLLLVLWDAPNRIFFYELAMFCPKTTQRHFLFTLHPLSTVIFATATILAFVLLRNSNFNFHCYTQREATPTQKSARKCAATSRDFFRERLQSAFTLANQLR